MDGKYYSSEANDIRYKFDDVAHNVLQDWHDQQSEAFDYDYITPISDALNEMQVPIECLIDKLDTKLNEIIDIAQDLNIPL